MNPWRSLRGLPRPLFIVAAATLVNRAGTMVLPFLILFLTRSVGMSAETAATMLVVYGATALVAAPLGGRLCDRYGPRAVAIASLVLSGCAMLAYPLARTPAEIAVATVALALTGEMFRPASMTLFGQLAPKGMRKQSFALGRMAVNLGMTVGPATGGFLATWWFPAIFIADGATSLASAVFMAFALPRAPAPAPAEQDSAATTGATTAEPEPEPEPTDRRAYRDPAFLYFLVALLASAMVFFQMDAALPLYMVRDLGLSERAFGTLFAVNTILILLFEVALNDATSKWPARRSMSLAALLIGCGFASVGVATGALTLGISVVVFTFGEMILFPAAACYVSDIAPPGRSGEYMGWYTMAFGVAFTIAPWTGTAVLERFGADALWSAVLVVGLLATALFAFVSEPPSSDPDRGDEDPHP